MTLGMGNVYFALSVNGTDVGVAIFEDLVVIPGYQEVGIRAVMYEEVVNNIVLAQGSSTLPVDFVGVNSTVDGQQIPYYTTMVQQIRLQNNLDLTRVAESDELVAKRSLLEWDLR